MKRFKVQVREVKLEEMVPELYLEAGRCMKDALDPALWNRADWALGTVDSAPGLNTAVGFIKMCDRFVFLFVENEEGAQTVAGICAGITLSKTSAGKVDLRKGLDRALVASLFDQQRSVPVCGDFYHSIIAIDDICPVERLPLRGRKIQGKSIARVMFGQLIDIARRDGCTGFWSKTHPDLQKVLHLFEQHGLVHVGSQDYAEGNVRRVVYAANLSARQDVSGIDTSSAKRLSAKLASGAHFAL